MRKIYSINVSWKEWGIMKIEADSLEEAERIAREEAELPDGNYIGDSFRLDKEAEGYGECEILEN